MAAISVLVIAEQSWGRNAVARPGPSVAPSQVTTPPRAAEGQTLSIGDRGDSRSQVKLVVVEFSDFQCPYCGAYARDSYARVMRDFVDSGIADYAFRHLPLRSIHPFAAKAGEAAECAREQGKFADMHDRLFADQKNLSEADLVKHAISLGLNQETFSTCLSGRMVSTVKLDENEAVRLGINSTPTFLVGVKRVDGTIKIGRQITGAHPYDEIKAALSGLGADASLTN
jgi:protein-disulfide isomerase